MPLLPPLQAELTVRQHPSHGATVTSRTFTRASLQLTDGAGRPLTWRAAAFAYLSPDPDGRTLAQEPTSRWSSPNGAIVPLASDRAALVITDNTGRLDLDLPVPRHTHAPERRYLVVALPTGPVLFSPPLVTGSDRHGC